MDLENLMVAGKLSMLVVGEDVLRTNGEVGITHLSFRWFEIEVASMLSGK